MYSCEFKEMQRQDPELKEFVKTMCNKLKEVGPLAPRDALRYVFTFLIFQCKLCLLFIVGDELIVCDSCTYQKKEKKSFIWISRKCILFCITVMPFYCNISRREGGRVVKAPVYTAGHMTHGTHVRAGSIPALHKKFLI